MTKIVGQEERCLERVLGHLDNRKLEPEDRSFLEYDRELIALRDEIATARLEDVPPLLEQMERLQSIAARRRRETTQGFVDARSPYFGRLMLKEGDRQREVLIGRGTYLDTASGVRIVDWRDAPVSRLYYRYEEGDEYDEVFGEREVTGEVLLRRSVSIIDRTLRRITSPQGSFVRTRKGSFKRLTEDASKLHGGQGMAIRAEQHHRPGKLGVGDDQSISEDKHLKEITPLIDRRQFELITRPDSGLVVIQGGAGSGKTTIGLHRLAYLAYQDKRRFRPDRMLVVVFNEALARYISQVLPALGLSGVGIRTYEDWAARVRATHLPELPRRYSGETPSVVTRLKKHPAMLKAIDGYVEQLERTELERLENSLRNEAAEVSQAAVRAWSGTRGRPYAHRLHALERWLSSPQGQQLSTDARVSIERQLRDGLRRSRDLVSHWAELLSDQQRLRAVFNEHAPGEFSDAQIQRAHAWCAARSSEVIVEAEERQHESHSEGASARRRRKDREEGDDERNDERREGVDGYSLDEGARLDREDDTLFLRLFQKLRGPLRRGAAGKEPLVYEHVLIDEAQDLSPVELSVVIDTVSRGQSVTLAGDVAQRLLMDNGFSDWKTVLGELGLSHVEVEPLKLSYRSTAEILEFAGQVLGPLAPEEPPQATRRGAPVELFEFAHNGDAVGFLSEALRDLMREEPRASVAVIARFPEQADVFYDGLKKGEVPYLRRITDQDFPFRAGVDVTDVRQVKGLEFDYVVLVDVSEASYPAEDESRHLLHIGATRAAHQLWIVCSGRPSQLLPESLRDRDY